MTVTSHPTAPERASVPGRTPMSPMRKAALIAGLVYIATLRLLHPRAFGLWADVLAQPQLRPRRRQQPGVPLGALFEVLTALTGIVTAVALYTVAKRYSHRAALGFVTTRILEAAMIFVGVLSVLSVYTLRQDVAGTPAPTPAPWSPPATPSSP